MDLEILFITYSGMRRYANVFLTLLRRFLVPCPKILIISDTRVSKIDHEIETGIREWVSSLYHGLIILRKQSALPKYILLILDDLVPIRPVDMSSLEKGFSIMKSQGWRKLSFFIDPPERYSLEVECVEGSLFYKIPRPSEGVMSLFPWYNSLQVAIWETDYLYDVCEQALAQDIHDPWRFEHLVTLEKHYVAEYRWPSEFQGLHFIHNIHLAAVMHIQGQIWIKGYLLMWYLIGLPRQVAWRLRSKFIRVAKRNKNE